jgi:hypothetical protein
MEILNAVSKPRTLFLRVGLTLLLGLPFVLAPMPLRVRVSGLLMLILFTGLFGAAVSRVRRRTDGRLEIVRLLPLRPAVAFLDFALAGAAVDVLQTGPLLALFFLLHAKAPSLALLVATTALFVAVALILNLAGLALGTILETNAEVHLAGALTVALLAFASGLIPAPERIRAVLEALQAMNPLTLLAKVLSTAPVSSSIAAPGGVAISTGFLLLCGAWFLQRLLRQ